MLTSLESATTCRTEQLLFDFQINVSCMRISLQSVQCLRNPHMCCAVLIALTVILEDIGCDIRIIYNYIYIYIYICWTVSSFCHASPSQMQSAEFCRLKLWSFAAGCGCCRSLECSQRSRGRSQQSALEAPTAKVSSRCHETAP